MHLALKLLENSLLILAMVGEVTSSPKVSPVREVESTWGSGVAWWGIVG